MTATLPRVPNVYRCPAKINLGLEVLYKRPDGYHELNTIFVRLEDVCDEISVAESGGFALACDSRDLDVGESNLIVRAAEAFASVTGRDLPQLKLTLTKRIPMGAGLGGGSSDAATSLLICNDASGNPLTTPELATIGASIGADVPFFVSGFSAARASGIGEAIQPIELALDCWALLVKPESVAISTKEAYAGLSLTEPKRPADLVTALRSRSWDLLQNDFEQSIFSKAPVLLEIKSELYSAGAMYAAMSGSGATMYGLFEEESAATRARSTFDRHFTALARLKV